MEECSLFSNAEAAFFLSEIWRPICQSLSCNQWKNFCFDFDTKKELKRIILFKDETSDLEWLMKMSHCTSCDFEQVGEEIGKEVPHYLNAS